MPVANARRSQLHKVGITVINPHQSARCPGCAAAGADAVFDHSDRAGAARQLISQASAGQSRASDDDIPNHSLFRIRLHLGPPHDAAAACIERIALVHQSPIVPDQQVPRPPGVTPDEIG